MWTGRQNGFLFTLFTLFTLYTCLLVYLISFPQEPAMLFSPSLPPTIETATFAFG
jgi:hypothetical protein